MSALGVSNKSTRFFRRAAQEIQRLDGTQQNASARPHHLARRILQERCPISEIHLSVPSFQHERLSALGLWWRPSAWDRYPQKNALQELVAIGRCRITVHVHRTRGQSFDTPPVQSTGINPSVRVCMKLTIASSSASERPSRPTRLLFIFSVDSGTGQHVVPSPTSWGLQRGSTSRVL